MNTSKSHEATTVRSMPAVQSKLIAQTRTTVKMQACMPCNHYYNVVVTNEQGAWQGRIVTFLSLEDWAALHGYEVKSSGSHLYCDPDGLVMTKLVEMATSPIAS